MTVTRRPHIPISRDKDFPIYQSGVKEGQRQMGSDILTFLQERYMAEDVQRGTPEAESILKLASELADHIRVLKGKA